jgi:hypothetical protein
MHRFTLRDLLWLTTLIATAAGWFADHALQQRKLQRERDVNIEAAAEVQTEWLRRYRGEDSPLGTP